MSKIITTEALLQRLRVNPDLVLFEALPQKYYLEGHLPGARYIPHDRVSELAASVLPDKSAEIVVYCASDTCQNSDIAAKLLTQLGYANVAVYRSGKKGWAEAGLPLEREALATTS